MNTSPLSIAIDGRNLMHPPAGSATYLVCALNELTKLHPSWKFHILTNRPIHPECAKLIKWRENVTHIQRAFTKNGLFWYCTQLYFNLKSLKPDYFWAPATLLPPRIPAGIKTIVTVNDFVPIDYKHTMSAFNRAYSNIFFDKSIRTADVLLAISEYTASQIKVRYPERRSRTIMVGCGVDREIFKPLNLTDEDRKKVLGTFGLSEKFILFVGTVEPRKNLEFMLELMPGLAVSGVKLVVVGAKGWGKTKIATIVQREGFPSEQVVLAGYVSTEVLVKLYNLAAVYVSTSLNEGFGLPQLEAMNCGCPVVSPHNSAMIEVVTGAGMTVEGWDVQVWIDTILEVAQQKEKYRELGLARASCYEWSDFARRFSVALGIQ